MRFWEAVLPAGMLFVSISLASGIPVGRPSALQQKKADQSCGKPHVLYNEISRRVESEKTESKMILRLVIEKDELLCIKQFVIKMENIIK